MVNEVTSRKSEVSISVLGTTPKGDTLVLCAYSMGADCLSIPVSTDIGRGESERSDGHAQPNNGACI